VHRNVVVSTLVTGHHQIAVTSTNSTCIGIAWVHEGTDAAVAAFILHVEPAIIVWAITEVGSLEVVPIKSTVATV
jgi:hypothetical protein